MADKSIHQRSKIYKKNSQRIGLLINTNNTKVFKQGITGHRINLNTKPTQKPLLFDTNNPKNRLYRSIRQLREINNRHYLSETSHYFPMA